MIDYLTGVLAGWGILLATWAVISSLREAEGARSPDEEDEGAG